MIHRIVNTRKPRQSVAFFVSAPWNCIRTQSCRPQAVINASCAQPVSRELTNVLLIHACCVQAGIATFFLLVLRHRVTYRSMIWNLVDSEPSVTAWPELNRQVEPIRWRMDLPFAVAVDLFTKPKSWQQCVGDRKSAQRLEFVQTNRECVSARIWPPHVFNLALHNFNDHKRDHLHRGRVVDSLQKWKRFQRRRGTPWTIACSPVRAALSAVFNCVVVIHFCAVVQVWKHWIPEVGVRCDVKVRWIVLDKVHKQLY